MQTVYLNDKTEFGSMDMWEMKNPNRYGTMYGMAHKLDLITTENVGDYYVFRSNSDSNKLFLALDSRSQMGVALGKLQADVSKEKGFNFKPTKEKIYIKISEQQALNIPKFHNLMVSVQVYGVFLQNTSNVAFLQCELSGFKATPRLNFDACDDNAVFP